MLRIAHYTAILAAALLVAVGVTSCKTKTRDDNRRELLEAIEHYNIPPVDTTGQGPIASPEVDEIVVRYPELYHAVRSAQRLHKEWAEQEQKMVSTVFVGNAKARKDKAKACEANFLRHLAECSVTHLLDFVLLSTEELPAEEWQGAGQTDSIYSSYVGMVADNMAASAEHATTDDMRSAVGFARRAWQEYLAALQQYVTAVPETCRARYTKAVNDLVRQHRIDLLNRYYPYYESESPAWLLPYAATDDQIQAYQFHGLHDRSWIKPQP